MTYNDNGNIDTKSDIGTTSYSYGTNAGPYALTGVTSTGLIPTDTQTATYTSFEKVTTLTEGLYSASIIYNSDNQRAKMTVTQSGSTILTRWYAGSSYMKQTAAGVTKEYTYIGGDAYSAPVAAVTHCGTTTYYYLLRDHLGSITHVVRSTDNTYSEYSYDAWGRRRNPTDWSYNLSGQPGMFVDRGFTGHEYLPWFNLVNMNGRLYDPLVGRFLNVDPYVQMSDYTQNYNRYSYCLNNPLRYTDPDGEFWHIVAGAVIGGGINLAMNWDNCSGFWEYAAAFGVGALGGAVTAAVGGADGGASFWAITGTAALAGGVTSGTVNWGQVGINSAIGSVAGFGGSAAGYWAANSSFVVNTFDSPLLRSAVVSPLAAGAGHIAGGTTSGLLQGQSFNAAFENSFKGLGNSMLMGAALGVSTTVGMSFAKGMNPLNGKTLWPKNNGFRGSMERTILDEGTTFDRYGDEAGRFAAPDGTPFDSRSLSPNTKLSPLTTYKVVNPLPAYQGTSSGSFWFNSSGGGTQYMFDYNVNYLLQNGYIIRVP